MDDEGAEITRLLNAFRDGDAAAGEQLAYFLYPELHQLAAKNLHGKQPGHTWQPTALINEAYLRLVERGQPEWRSRAHFFAVASTIMRNILVDHARKRLAAKRGGGGGRVTWDDALEWTDERPQSLIALNDALDSLAKFDPRRARMLEMRFFGGLSVEESAEALGVSRSTVERDMRIAGAWLSREIEKKYADE